MRPPLVLEVFEQHPTIGPLAYRSDGAFMPYTLLATEKKFTDAELAAEFEAARCDYLLSVATGSYWSELGDMWSHDADAVCNRSTTLLHFAARPHAADSDYE